jgi:hypothetical protein
MAGFEMCIKVLSLSFLTSRQTSWRGNPIVIGLKIDFRDQENYFSGWEEDFY